MFQIKDAVNLLQEGKKEEEEEYADELKADLIDGEIGKHEKNEIIISFSRQNENQTDDEEKKNSHHNNEENNKCISQTELKEINQQSDHMQIQIEFTNLNNEEPKKYDISQEIYAKIEGGEQLIKNKIEIQNLRERLNVKSEVEYGASIKELEDEFWINLESKMKSSKKALVAAIICRGIFTIVSAYFSLSAFTQLGSQAARLVILYFLKNLVIIHFYYKLGELLNNKFNDYYNFKLRASIKKKELDIIIQDIDEFIIKEKQILAIDNQDAIIQIPNSSDNNQNIIIIADEQQQPQFQQELNQFPQDNIQNEKDHLDLQFKSKSNDGQQQPLQEENNQESQQQPPSFMLQNPLHNSQQVPLVCLEQNEELKNNQNEEKVEDKDQDQKSSQEKRDMTLNENQLKEICESQKLLILKAQEGLNNQDNYIEYLKVSLSTFKRNFQARSDIGNKDILNKLKEVLLSEAPKLNFLSHLLKFCSLVLTAVSLLVIFSDKPTPIKISFIVLIWINVTLDNLQIFAFAALITVVFTFFVIIFLYKLIKNYIQRFIYQRKLKQRIDQLKQTKFGLQQSGDNSNSEVKECSICLSDYIAGEELIILPCDKKHVFHKECILAWIKMNNDCPFCRKKIFP